MDLKNNYNDQREYLKKNLAQINTVVSAVLGVRVDLKIEESKNYKNAVYFHLMDNNNYQKCCGMMAKAFSVVNIETFNVWWKDNGVTMSMQFKYDHIDGGSNGAHFCYIDVINDFVSIR